ncbi:unnamed protein product [Protopolystoma xenopodis]|uniref:Uncharacterized protein n=1 Tax=Protopolystoma xenopodis TaxID=117903 RepID=A0A3S5B9Y2_9PLAT|nr:unnamed protein product [Protopolystoma xenopodis]
MQATTSGCRLIGLQLADRPGCLAEWHPLSGRGVSCLAAHGSLVCLASGACLYTLRIVWAEDTQLPGFNLIAYAKSYNL